MHGLNDDQRKNDGVDDEAKRYRCRYYCWEYAWCFKGRDRNVGIKQDKLSSDDPTTRDAISIRLKKIMNNSNKVSKKAAQKMMH
jgi:hypothetical protein